MRRIDRFQLIEQIASDLQARMVTSDINQYLSSFGIDFADMYQDSVGSKRVYVKNILGSVDDATILSLADELGLPHAFSGKTAKPEDATFWLHGHFRLFLSHLSSHKKHVTQLQHHLKPFGISAFVAHADISPTKEWQIEIEKALATMDALAALLTEKFKQSDWCDQEVGVAVGRDVLVIPITVETVPYGFIAKYQAMQGKGRYAADIASSIFKAIGSNSKTSNRMAEVIVGLVLSASSADDATQKLKLLLAIDPLSDRHLKHLRDNILSNKVLHETGHLFFRELNSILEARGLGTVSRVTGIKGAFDDDEIPF